MGLGSLLFGPSSDPAAGESQWGAVPDRAHASISAAAADPLLLHTVQQQAALSARVARSMLVTLGWAAVMAFVCPVALALWLDAPPLWATFVLVGNVLVAAFLWGLRLRSLPPLLPLATAPEGSTLSLGTALTSNTQRLRAQTALHRAVARAFILSACWMAAVTLAALAALLAT